MVICVAKRYGLKIRVHVYGKKSGYILAAVCVEGDPRIISALKKIGLKIAKKPVMGLFDKKILAMLQYSPKKPIPVGLGENNEIVNVDKAFPIAVDDKYLAMAIVEKPVLWLDFKGDSFPVEAGYKEYSGFGIPTSQTKIQNIANGLAPLLKTKPENIISAMNTQKDIMADVELRIVDPLKQFFDWKILSEEKVLFENENYIDLSGLPLMLQKGALIIATHIWDYDMVIHIPRAWKWVADIVKYRGGTIIVCETARGLNIQNIISENKLIRKTNFMGSTVILEKDLKIFWDLSE